MAKSAREIYEERTKGTSAPSSNTAGKTSRSASDIYYQAQAQAQTASSTKKSTLQTNLEAGEETLNRANSLGMSLDEYRAYSDPKSDDAKAMKEAINPDYLWADIAQTNKNLEHLSKNEWIDSDTLSSYREQFNDVNDRVKQYKDYIERFGQDSDYADYFNQLSEFYGANADYVNGLTEYMGNFQNAEAYENAKIASELREKYKGLTYDQVKAEKAKYSPDSVQYKFFDNYGNYTDENGKYIGYSNLADYEADLADRDPKSNSASTRALRTAVNEIGYQENAAFKKYSDVMNNADYRSNSSAKNGSWLSGVINNPSEHENLLRNETYYQDVYNAATSMTPEEVGVFNYIENTQGQEAAEKYFDDMTSTLLRRSMERRATELDNSLNSDGFFGEFGKSAKNSLSKFWNSTVGLVERAGSNIEAGVDFLTGKGIDTNSSYFWADTKANVIRNSAQERAAHDIEWLSGGGHPILADIARLFNRASYSATQSQIMTQMPVIGQFYETLMGLDVFGSTARQKINEGYNEDKAVAIATAEAAIEWATEHLPSEEIRKYPYLGTRGDVVKAIGATAASEGYEELVGSLLGNIADAFIMRKDSELLESIDQYMEQGYSKRDAILKTLDGFSKDALMSGVEGALSGFLGGVPGTIINYNANKRSGQNIINNGSAKDLFTVAGKNTDKNTLDYLQKLEKQGITADNYEKATAGQLGSFARTVMEGASDRVRNEVMEDAIERKLTKVGVENASEMAKAIVAEKPTAAQKELLKNSYAKAIIEDIRNGKKWVRDINSATDATKDELGAIDRINRRVKDREKNVLDDSKKYTTGTQELSDGATIKEVKSKDGEIVGFVSSDGQTIDAKDAKLTRTQAHIVEMANNIDSEEKRAAFLDNYVPGMEAIPYADSFNMAWMNGEHNLGIKDALNYRGILSPDQIAGIYGKARSLNKEALEKNIEERKNLNGGKAISANVSHDKSLQLDLKSGTISNPNGTKHKMSKAHMVMYNTINAFAKKAGINIVWYNSMNSRGKLIKDEGFYQLGTNTIHLDIYGGAGTYASDMRPALISVFSHELTHWAKARTTLYSELQEAVFNNLLNSKTYNGGRFRNANDIITHEMLRTKKSREVAIDEIMARSCQEMLNNGKMLDEFFDSMSEENRKSLFDHIKGIINDFKALFNEAKFSDGRAESMALRDCMDLVDKWETMLNDAIKNNAEMGGRSADTIINSEVKEAINDGAGIVEGNIVSENEAAITMNSLRTQDERGWKTLDAFLETADLTDKEKAHVVDQMHWAYNTIKKYSESGELASFGNWQNAEYKLNENGEPVFSVVVPNGDYEMNIDFTTVCKKRDTLDQVLNRLVREGYVTGKKLNQSEVAKLNEIIKSEGFEIACSVCFVDSKRYNIFNWAHSMTHGTNTRTGFNEMVASMTNDKVGMDYFDYVSHTTMYDGQDISLKDGQKLLTELSDEELLKLNPHAFDFLDDCVDGLKKQYANKKNPEGYKSTFEYRMIKALREDPSMRRLLNPGDFVSSEGQDKIFEKNKTLNSLIESLGGSSRPKPSHSRVAYNSEILVNKAFTSEAAFMVGGVRVQSFSDFMANMTYDYMQMVGEMEAKKLPSHAYTKESLFAKLFGKTGIKINMSIMPKGIDWDGILGFTDDMTDDEKKAAINEAKKNLTKSQETILRKYAGLKMKTENGKFVPVLDEQGRYIPVVDDETFPLEEALKIRKADGYSKNCGTIWIGTSREQIMTLLDMEEADMIIPYHASSLNKAVKEMRNIQYIKDYTKFQRTRYKSTGKAIPASKEFNWYESLQNTQDARATADEYKRWCEENEYIAKFDEFKSHRNYYKLLADFRMYDGDESVMQQAVRQEYPGENDAFGSFESIMLEGLGAAEKTSRKLNSKIDGIIDRANRELKLNGPDNVRHSTRNTAPTFYSHMSRTIDGIKQDKIGASSVVSYLKGKGVKDDEIAWTGITDWLQGKKSVTKKELQEFMAANQLVIEESVNSKDQTYIYDSDTDEHLTPEKFMEKAYAYAEESGDTLTGFDTVGGRFYAYFTDEDGYEYDISGQILDNTKWSMYKMDGGDNYRELKLKLPGSDYSNRAMEVHWDDRGVIAHARIQDFMANGKKVLFVEEVQSDWHNAGAKNGYSSMSKDDYKKMYDSLDSLKREKEKCIDKFSALYNDYAQIVNAARKAGTTYDVAELVASGENPSYIDARIVNRLKEVLPKNASEIVAERKSLTDKINDLSREIEAKQKKVNEEKGKPPVAPFAKTYTDFVMKRLLREAAENGYDSIGWTTAKQQEDRWSSDYAEGYRIEYDQDIPKFMNKYGKKWGGKVDQVTLDNGETVWNFTIPDAMKESVLTEGQTLFSKRNNDPKYINMGTEFSGGGMLEAGLQYKLLQKAFAVEYDSKIASVYKDNWGNHIYAGSEDGDVFKFDVTKHPDTFFFHASPVCHDFSIAKHGRKELQADKDAATKVANDIEKARPAVVSIENAPAYLKSESLAIIKNKLDSLGYNVRVGVYNSADYGSATSRDRCILVATREGIELPAEPKKMPRTNSWDAVTKHLWDGLKVAKSTNEKPMPPSFESAFRNTKKLKSLFNADGTITVDKPLLLLATTNGHEVTFAWEGNLCPTLTTKCGDARLILPGKHISLDTPNENIRRVSPEFMGAIQGLPADYNYGKRTSTAFTIVGNGIPTHLTKNVIGSVIESAYEQENGAVLYSRRGDAAENAMKAENELSVRYSERTKPDPTKTVEVYKLMRLKDGQIYPLFIDSTEPLKKGTWYDADSPDLGFLKKMPSGISLVDMENGTYETWEEVLARTGESKKARQKFPSKDAVKQAAKEGKRYMFIEDVSTEQKRFGGETRKYWNIGINGSGSVSTFSMRPGYHAGSLPTMRQIGKGKNKDLRDDTFVWTRGRMPADINYQEEADRNPDKDIPTHIPTDGYYLKATNADKAKSQADLVGWYVAGSYIIDEIISDADARNIIDKWNVEHPDSENVLYDYDRESGMDFDAKQMKLVERKTKSFSEQDILEASKNGSIHDILVESNADKEDQIDVAEKSINEFIEKGTRLYSVRSRNRTGVYSGESGIRTIALGVATELVNRKRIDFRGKYIGDGDKAVINLASLHMALRHPGFETFRRIYVKNGVIVATEGVTSKLPCFSTTSEFDTLDDTKADIEDRMNRLGADSFYLLHNHPDGDPRPSTEDFKVTTAFSKIKGFKRHIVIDHNKFCVQGADGKTFLGRTSSKESKDFRTPVVDHPLLYSYVDNASQVAMLGMGLSHGSNVSVLSITDAKSVLLAMFEVPNNFVTSHTFLDYVKNMKNLLGGHKSFITTTSSNVYNSKNVVTGIKMRFINDVVDIAEARAKTNEGIKGSENVVANGISKADVKKYHVGSPTVEYLPQMRESTRSTGDEIYTQQDMDSLTTQYMGMLISERAKNSVKLAAIEAEAKAKIAKMKFTSAHELKQAKAEMRQKLLEERAKKDAEYAAIMEDMRKKAQARAERQIQKSEEMIAHVREVSDKRIERMKESAGKQKYKDSIMKLSKDLNTMLNTNSKDKHVPKHMENTVVYMLNAINFNSKTLLAGGDPTLEDMKLSRALAKVREMAEKVERGNIDPTAKDVYDQYIDLPPEFKDMVSEIEKSVNSMIETTKGRDFVINEMSAQQLKELEGMLKILKHSISQMDTLLANVNAGKVSTLSQTFINHADKIGTRKAKITDGIADFFDFTNATPFYALRRFGEAGKKLMDSFMDAQEKLAFHVDEISKFANEAYTSEEINEWRKTEKEFTLANGQKLTMSIPHIMTLYCTAKREQAKGHLQGGGIRIADYTMKGKTVQQKKGTTITQADLAMITGTLTARQKEVADSLQNYMNTVGSEWGNRVTMARYGIMGFTEKNYFPIHSDDNSLPSDGKSGRKSMMQIANMPFTMKPIQGANNQILINDIFSEFKDHMSDMARYDSFALPIIDAYRFYSYKEKVPVGKTGAFETNSVKKSMDDTYGEKAKSYFTRLLDDINGTQTTAREPSFMSKAVGHYKVAAVAGNLRVAILQPTSYVRAAAVLDPKYLAYGLTGKNEYNELLKYSGTALWKSFGGYDTDVSHAVEDMIEHSESTLDKIVEKSGVLAEKGDAITWGWLWKAVKKETSDKGFKEGTDEFYKAASNRFREVVYATQVMDSVLTRSEAMRNKGWGWKALTSFMSEPTLAMNCLTSVYADWKLDARANGGDMSKGLRKYGKPMANAIMIYTASAFTQAVVESLIDAARYRDDDDEYWEKYMEEFWSNLKDEINPITKLPLIKDLWDMIEPGIDAAIHGKKVNLYGLSTGSNMSTEGYANMIKALFSVYNDVISGNGMNYKTVNTTIKAASQATGIPLSNAMREVKTIWNNSIAQVYKTLWWK